MPDTRLSEYLSLVLRHRPDSIGVAMDAEGWVCVSELIDCSMTSGMLFTKSDLEQVVRLSDKKRFAISTDGLRIRAVQGHSIPISLGLYAIEPPEELFHGTATRFIDSIRQQGLCKGQRNHVHLSSDAEMARNVGTRYGKPMVLQVQSGDMHRQNHIFLKADNGVWLTEHVPTEFLLFPNT